jgi:hypothetical protein
VIFSALVFLATGALLVSLFNRLPIEGTTLAIDWQAIHAALEGGVPHYGGGLAFFIAPWDAVLIAPLGLLSMRTGWGVLSFLTLAVTVVSVPRVPQKWRYWLAIVLLVLSFPSLRHMVDGEMEALVIGGAVLMVYAYRARRPVWLALGLLLALAKPQDSLLLVVAVGLYALPDALRPFWLKVGAVLAVIVVPSLLWKGADWIHAVFGIREQGSIMDTSLHAALNRAALPPPLLWLMWGALLAVTLVVVWRSRPSLSREKAGMLVAASLLLSPYAAGNSLLTVLAVGVVPLFLRKPWLGGLLMVMMSLPYLFSRDLLYYGQAYYGTLTLFVCWAVFAWRVWRGADKVRLALPLARPGTRMAAAPENPA